MANEQVVLSRAFVSVCPVLLNPSLTLLNVNTCCHLLTCPGRACLKIAFALFLHLRSTRAVRLMLIQSSESLLPLLTLKQVKKPSTFEDLFAFLFIIKTNYIVSLIG